MRNKASLEKAIEIFVLITLPVALIVGCEGTFKQRDEADKTDEARIIGKSYDLSEIYPLFSNEGTNPVVNKILQTRVDTDKQEKGSLIMQIDPDADSVVQMNETMVPVSYIGPEMTVQQNDMINIQKDDPVMIKAADNNADILTSGANSTLAYQVRSDSGHVELQPSYQVFNFETDVTSVQEYEHFYLKQHASYLANNPNLLLVVSGHADNRGSRIYNEELSRQRADEVIRLLTGFGAPESQIQLKAYGESVPVIDSTSMKENRRVELKYIDNTLISAK